MSELKRKSLLALRIIRSLKSNHTDDLPKNKNPITFIDRTKTKNYSLVNSLSINLHLAFVCKYQKYV